MNRKNDNPEKEIEKEGLIKAKKLQKVFVVGGGFALLFLSLFLDYRFSCSFYSCLLYTSRCV